MALDNTECDHLAVAIVQFDIEWENKKANFDRINDLLDRVSTEVDLIVLPEMFSTGFSMNHSSLCEGMKGESFQFLKELSLKFNCAACGSLIIKDGENVYNRWIWYNQGEIQFYDKRHLFSMGGENKHYAPGQKRIVVEYKGWKILPQICYDLRFPVWSRNDLGYDVLLNVANWPSARQDVWNTLLKARAIENQSYVVACNRVGTDAMGISYLGGSVAIDPKGKLLNEILEREAVVLISLSKPDLVSFRRKFPVLSDIDDFSIKN